MFNGNILLQYSDAKQIQRYVSPFNNYKRNKLTRYILKNMILH